MAPTNTYLVLLLMSTVVCYQLNILMLLLLHSRTVRKERLRSFAISQNMTKMMLKFDGQGAHMMPKCLLILELIEH